MDLHFITSVSKEYWYETAQYCIPTWDLPGKVTIYIDQKEGDVDWFTELPFNKRLLHVPDLKEDYANNKVFKFWGKTSAQLHAVYDFLDRRNSQLKSNPETMLSERVVWLDADIEQVAPVTEDMFTFDFKEPLGMMYSGQEPDCWETGIVIFNQQYFKLRVVMNRYQEAWNDLEVMNSLWKPYDAQVLGHVAKDKGYYNLCKQECKNIDSVENSIYGTVFKHWINKTNKEILRNEQR